MRKYIVLLLVSFSLISLNIGAKNTQDQLDITDLPKGAKFIIDNHFGETEVLSITHKRSDKIYHVKLKNGKKLTFNSLGDWIYIDCKNDIIPLLLIPNWVRNQIAHEYGPYIYPVMMSKQKRKLRIRLSNQIELELK